MLNYISIYNEWFNNKEWWFNYNVIYDEYLYKLYYNDIINNDLKLNEILNQNNIKNLSKEYLIGIIIAYDQIPRNIKRITTEINVDKYTKIARKVSNYIINNNNIDNIIKFDNITAYDWCFIFLPYRHLKEIDNINKSIEFILYLYDKSYIKEDKVIYKKFINNSLNSIYKLKNEKTIIKQKDYIIYNYNENSWNYFNDLLLNSENLNNPFKINENDEIYKHTLNKIKKINNNNIIVSLSGGVDSIICLYLISIFKKKN